MQGVSIIIPAYNAEETITECLSAIQNLDWDGNLEVILVNDGSTDNTANIASTFAKVGLISISHGGVAARSINVGVHAASHDTVVIVDADAILMDRDWLKKIIPWFNEAAVAAVGGFAITANESLLGKAAGYYAEMRRNRAPIYTDVLGGVSTAYRRPALLEVGMYDETMVSGEDVDISRKLVAAGYRLVLEKNARCKHFYRDELGSYVRQQYDFAYYRLEITRKFKKPCDKTVRPGLIFQVPFTMLVVGATIVGSFWSPFAPLALLLLPLIHVPDAIAILSRKRCLNVALVLPFIFTLRNLVWTYAAAVWGLRRIFRVEHNNTR